MRINLVLYFLLLTCAFSQAQEEVWMHKNAGQWDPSIAYKIDMQDGEMLIGNTGFSFVLNDIKQHESHHNHNDGDDVFDKVKLHVVNVDFLNSNWSGKTELLDSSSFYRNYFLGKDQSKWKGRVRSYSHVALKDYYPNIDLIWDGRNSNLEYSFNVAPNSNPEIIQMNYSGCDSLFLDDEGQLVFTTRFGNLIQSKPKAWTVKDGRRKDVDVEFVLTKNTVSFLFPKGYDHSAELIIDPSIVFSSFTGSTLDNWGMTATPDNEGNTFAGGIVFTGSGSYPTIAGSYDLDYNGGTPYTYSFNGGTWSLQGFDVAISKFNVDGTNLLFSTYLGGSANEAPHSMVVDENDELYVFGVTSSASFPTTAGAYDQTFNGGPNISSNELGYPEGSDIFITHFNAAGSGLVGSTFIGGTGTDGINEDDLNYNYGDPFRGEIIVNGGNVYVSSTSRSNDFPVVNAAQNTLNGIQDAIVFKLNAGLTNLSWSTYFGGPGYESGNSLQLSSTGELFVTGGTTSFNLPISGGFDNTYAGGVSDGYILKMDEGSGTFTTSTYVGLGEYDQCYFVQLDLDDEVYVYGQTETAYTITPGLYGVNNSGQFLKKFSNDLTSELWTTMIGGGTGHPEISPTAFLVSDCYDIYISGWGGTINTSYSNQAQFSTTNGFPVTADAYQSGTNGSNFYIAVLSQDAATLKYATYMGGTASSFNHVDGGTSRFDKSGRIYHAVCGACGGNDFGFTTTPGSWSPSNPSPNCNLAAFKFELNEIEALVSIPDPVVCLPDPVIFNNTSEQGNFYSWDFGDGSPTSYEENTSHVYPGPGTYTVTLVVSDTTWCFSPDSTIFDVFIGDFTVGVVAPPGAICPGESYQLEANGGTVYNWSPANVLDDPTSPTPIATLYETTNFMVVVSDTCGLDTAYVTVEVYQGNITSSNDTSICLGNSVNLFATGGTSYMWSPGGTLSDSTIANPVATPTEDVIYVVEATSDEGCQFYDSVLVDVYFQLPIPIMPDTVSYCEGASANIQVSGGDSYFWYPNSNISAVNVPNVTVNPPNDFLYYCDFSNACGVVTDSVYVDVVFPDVIAGNDTIICPGESATLWAQGASHYLWSPSNGLNSINTSLVIATPFQPTLYEVVGTDETGCTAKATVFVDLYPEAHIVASPDVYALQGELVQLSATSSTPGPFEWSPVEDLSCVVCSSPVATANQEMIYTVSYTDANGCTDKDQVVIHLDPIIYVPNTFTPDGGNHNEVFKVEGGNVQSIELMIFNRWGELIYTITSMDDFWDGTYEGVICQDGTYVWKAKVIDLKDKEHTLTGHVNLLR